jgi:multidrug resistance efflux pump
MSLTPMADDMKNAQDKRRRNRMIALLLAAVALFWYGLGMWMLWKR